MNISFESIKKEISAIKTDNCLYFERLHFESKVWVKLSPQAYVRINTFDNSTAQLGWIEWKWYGNILLIWVLQEMIRLNCNRIVALALPRDGTTLEDLLRFYEQIWMSPVSRKSSILSGEPFTYTLIWNFLSRTKSRLGS